MKRLKWSTLGIVAGIASVMGVRSTPLVAQQFVALDAPSARAVSPPADTWQKEPTVMDRRISMSLDKVSLVAALNEVARIGRVEIAYSRESLPKGHVASVQAEEATIASVLRQILAGTLLTTQLGPRNQVMIVPVEPTEDRAENGVVVGKVVHAKTKQPIVGATVTSSGGGSSVQTDKDGAFRLSLPAGSHTISLRSVGMVRQSVKVEVTENETVTVDIVMEPSASVLDEVVVTGTVIATERKAIPTPITVITADDIEKRGITRLEQIFRGQVPGVFALEQGSDQFRSGGIGNETFGAMETSQIYTRGASQLPLSISFPGAPNPLKTFVDGVELLNSAYLGTIDPASIERIEIITGPQAATIYGSGAMGGVMQIFTKKGQAGTSDFNINLKYGVAQNNIDAGMTPTHDHGIGVYGSTGHGFSYSVNASYNYLGQWRPGLFRRRAGLSFGLTHAFGPLTASGTAALTSGKTGAFNQGGLWGSPLYRSNAEQGIWRWTDNYGPADHVARRHSLSQSQTLGLTLDYQFSPSIQHHLTIGKNQSEFEIVPMAPGFVDYQDTLYASGTSTGHRISLSYNSTFVTSTDRFVSSSLTVGMTGGWGTQWNASGCVPGETATTFIPCGYSVNVSKSLDVKSWGGFGAWRIGLANSLFISLGLRGEKNPAYGRNHSIDWTPTNGITYSFDYGDVTVKLLGSYGVATRPPAAEMREEALTTFNQYYDPGQWVTRFANENLRPEYSRGPQGGVEVYYGNSMSFTLNHYRQRISDLIQRVTVDSIWVKVISSGDTVGRAQEQYMNAATIQQHGWEATASLATGPVTLRGTYTWADSRVLSSRIERWYPGYTFLATPSHTANLIATVSRGETSATWTVNYTGSANRQSSSNMVYQMWQNARIRTYHTMATSPFIQLAVPGYVKSDIAASHRLSPSLSLTLNVQNAGNRFNSDLNALDPTIGRQTFVGMSWRSKF